MPPNRPWRRSGPRLANPNASPKAKKKRPAVLSAQPPGFMGRDINVTLAPAEWLRRLLWISLAATGRQIVEWRGSPGRDRTTDQPVNSRLLYPRDTAAKGPVSSASHPARPAENDLVRPSFSPAPATKTQGQKP